MKCPSCGTTYAQGERFCGECGQARPEMAPGFLEAELRFQEIQRLRRTGEMGEAEYEEALRQLVLYENDSFWMLGADSGAWYRLEGEQWLPDEPPLAAAEGSASPSPPKAEGIGGRFRLPRNRLVLGLAIGVPLALVLVVALLAVLTPYPRLWQKSLAIMVSSDDADHYFDRALIYRYDLEDLDAAITNVSAAIDQAPSAFLYEWRGEVYAAQGMFARSAADYTQAIQMDPTLADLYVSRAEVYQKLGEPALALEDMNQAIQGNSGDCYFYFRRAELYAQLGETAPAREDFEEVMSFSEESCLWRAEAEVGLSGLGAVASVVASPTPGATAAAEPTATAEATMPAPTGTAIPIPTEPPPTSTPENTPKSTPTRSPIPTPMLPLPWVVPRSPRAVENGSFEDNLESWTGTEEAKITQNGYRGNAVAMGATVGVVSDIHQLLPEVFEAEKVYEVSGWCLAPTGASCHMLLGDASENLYPPANENQVVLKVPGTGTWQPVAAYLRMASDDRLYVFLYGTGTDSTVMYDEIKVQEVLCDMVCDGSFEEGLGYWRSIWNAALTSGFSNQGLQVSYDSSTSAVYQLLPGVFEQNKTYRAGIWCYADVGETCRLFFGDAGYAFNPPSNENDSVIEAEGTGAWQQLETTVTMNRDERMFIYLYSRSPGSSVIYDELVIEEVP